MTPALLFSFVIGYFVILLLVAWWTSRKSDNESFFIGNKNSNWMLVAFGMIGTSLSGVTFVSVPGGVTTGSFFYFQIVLGYLLGYFFIVSRVVGATARLYLVISILQIFIFDRLGIPFELTSLVILVLILLYTFEGGVKTIIYTDTLQTTGMLLGLVVCVIAITKALGTDFSGAMHMM